MTQTSTAFYPARLLILTGVLLVVYGYLCRFLKIYFFWESRSIGWALVFIGLAVSLIVRIKNNKPLRRRSIPEKIGIGIIAFILLAQVLLLLIFPNTDAYKQAITFLLKNESLRNEIGIIKGYSLVPLGQITLTEAKEEKMGSATLNFILKGEKKYRQVKVYLEKEAGTKWEIRQIE